jgi:zinc transporter, ZIP family
MLGLVVITCAVGCATAVGAVPILSMRQVSRRAYDAMLGLGAGLMLAAATLGLLPEALAGVRAQGGVDLERLVIVLSSFGAGVGLLFLMDRLIPHAHAGGHHEHMHGHEGADHPHCEHADVDERARHQGLLILGAMSLHRIPEGFAIGAGFAASRTQPLGVMLAVAVAVQNAVEGAVMAAPLKRGGLPPARLLLLVAMTGSAVPVAAVLGFVVSQHVAGALPAMLAVAAGALLYLTCNEIIPESHSHGNERPATFGLIAGFVMIIVIKVLVGE